MNIFKSIALTSCLFVATLTTSSLQAQTAWSRDVFREVMLTEHPNTTLYGVSPDDPDALFNIIFQAVLDGTVPCYKYDINGTDRTDSVTLTSPATLLADFHIPFRTVNGSTVVARDDMPTAQVTMLYLRERIAYNVATSSFSRQVLALCPVITEQQYDDHQPQRFPLCWINYKDIKPLLAKTLVSDDMNNSCLLSLEEWFSLQFYEGNIYKIQSRTGGAVKQYVHTQKEYLAEQQRINAALATLHRQTYAAPSTQRITK